MTILVLPQHKAVRYAPADKVAAGKLELDHIRPEQDRSSLVDTLWWSEVDILDMPSEDRLFGLLEDD